MKTYVVAVDVGGTNIKLGIVDHKGKVIARNSLPTKTFSSSKTKLIDALAHHIDALITTTKLTKKSIAGIGIGLPGLINPQQGIVRFLPNIPGWKNVPLSRLLKLKTGLKVFIDNDVKVITLAESQFGAGRGVKNMVCLTLGTGVGAGLILNGRLYRGVANAAGELGHTPLNQEGPACTCGGWGCFERYVGNKELFDLAGTFMGNAGEEMKAMKAKARQGNRKALAFWRQAGTRVGDGLVGIINLLNPELVVIGGGVSHNEQFLFPVIRQVIRRRCMSLQGKIVRIKRAHFKDDAGLIGAYVLVMDAQQHA